MEVHQIRYFLGVARERNFSRAAEICHVSQPSLSRAIRHLELELGGPLFDRRPGRIELTELGRLVLPRLQRASDELTDAKEEATGLVRCKREKLRLGLMCCVGPDRLMALIAKVRTRIPTLALNVREGRAEVVLDLLLRDEIDAAIVALPEHPEETAAIPLYRERFMVAFAEGHRFAALAQVALAQLAGEPMLQRQNCKFRDFYEATHGKWPVTFDVRCESDREDWIQALVASGMGCAIVPESLPLIPGIATRPLAEPAISRDVSLLTLRGRQHAQAAEALVRLAAAQASGHCARNRAALAPADAASNGQSIGRLEVS